MTGRWKLLESRDSQKYEWIGGRSWALENINFKISF